MLKDDVDAAEQLNSHGNELKDRGLLAEAEAAYRGAIAADPTWSVPHYNLGLLFKYSGRWHESLGENLVAVELDAGDEAAWWNLGIAATALSDWAIARRAWKACGIPIPGAEGRSRPTSA